MLGIIAMSSDTKIILGLSCFMFAILHLLLLAYVMMGLEGESKGFAILYLEWPAMTIWMPPHGDSVPVLYYAYIWIVGTLIYALVLGVPAGFIIDGIRRLFKWLNSEKWDA